MAKKRQGNLREYRFRIDAYSPETMPLGRLAEYLTDLAVLFGEDKSVHLVAVEQGSTVLLNLVEREAEPKIRERIAAVDRNDAPPEAMKAARSINERLRKDNAKGEVVDPVGDNLIIFPGYEQGEPLIYGPFNQPGVIIGVPTLVGGDNDPVPVHLKGAQGVTYNCLAKRDVAKAIAVHLFTTAIRAEGIARLTRNGAGEWETAKFTIKDFKPLSDATLRETIEELRAIPAEWKKKEDPLGELRNIRHGTDG
jgi:hypothetical protein